MRNIPGGICRPRRHWLAGALLAAALGALPAAQAELQIEITSGVRDPVPIAVVPFARAVPADGGLDVADVVQHDLAGSGRFRARPSATSELTVAP